MQYLRPFWCLPIVLSATLPLRSDESEKRRFQFRDVTQEVGLTDLLHGCFTHALAWGDWNGDGKPGLFLGTYVGLAHDKFQMFDFTFDATVRNNFYSACAFGMFVYLSAHATGQASVQRYLATPTVRAARWSLLLRGIAIALGCLVFFLVGTAIYVFYHQSAPRGFPELAKKDHILPHFVLTELSVPGLVGLLLAGLFSATTSTIDSGISSLTALAACDWFPGRRQSVARNRLFTMALGLGVTATSLLVPKLGENVFDIIIKISGALLGPLLGLFLLGMFVPRAGTLSATLGLTAGIASLFAALGTPLSTWWYGAVTCVPTVVVGTLVSLISRPPCRDRFEGG